jgi:agmatinase
VTNESRVGNGAQGLYPFVGIPTFLRAPVCTGVRDGSYDIAVLGVPTDEGSPFIPGSRFGPRAIREQSMRFALAVDSRFDIASGRQVLNPGFPGQRLADLGDVEVVPADPESTVANITRSVTEVLEQGALPVVLGGDHSITYPVVRAFDGPLHVVQFDAHLDYVAARGNYRYTNAHGFRQISRTDSVCGLTQVGIRSLRTAAGAFEDSVADGNRVVSPAELRELTASGLAATLPRDARCYVSIDVDVLDMPLVPGCVSAEPGGLTHDELRAVLAAVAEQTKVVGFDLVEVNPAVDTASGATAYLAAHVIIEFIDAICTQPHRAKQGAPPART